MPKIVAVMPIKMNNERLPGKNTKILGDKPLLRYELDTLLKIKELESKCKYKNCSHLSESGCAIQEALEREELDYNRYLRYLKLVGDESKRQTLLKGKAYEKERIIKELKSTRKSDRG